MVKIIAGNTPTYSMRNKQVEKSLVVVVFIAYWWGVNSSPINMLSFKTLIIRLKLIPKKLDLVEELDMDQHDAPKQHTPSSGLHYIFYVDGEQAKQI